MNSFCRVEDFGNTRLRGPAVVAIMSWICLMPLMGQSPNSIGADALALIQSKVLETKRTFWIFTNGDDQGHGFSSGKFGGGVFAGGLEDVFRRLDVNTHCVADLSSSDGCATSPQSLDCERGTVLRIKFPALSGDQYLGLNIEEPERFSDRPGTLGYDLRGATRLVFDVATPSATSARFEVGLAGKVRPLSIQKSDGWKTVSLTFGELGINDGHLLDAHVLFGLATNSSLLPAGGAAILLDNIRIEPAPTRQAVAVSLPGSTQTCGTVLRALAPIPIDQQLVGVSTIYEASISAIALARTRPAGYKTSLASIAEALTYVVNNDNAGLAVPPAADGSGAKGIRSGYKKGELPLYNSQPVPLLGRRGQAQLAGFSVPTDDLCGPSRYCLVTDEITGGNSGFAILALINAARELDESNFLATARSIGRWVAANLRDNDGYGGFFNGYRNPGNNDADKSRKILDRGKSIENIADLAAAYHALADVEAQVGNASEMARWTELATHAANAVFGMFIESEGRFAAGTTPDSASYPGIEPDCGVAKKNNDCLNRADLLDSNTFTTLALAVRPEYRTRLDWRRPLRWVLANQRKQVRARGTDFIGYSLVKQPVAGPDGIAWEFTGQVALTLRVLDSIYPNEGFGQQASQVLNAIRVAKAQAPFGDRRGIPAATLPDGNDLVGLRTPFQEIPQRVNLAATVFGVFAESSINLFQVPPRFTPDRVVNGASFAASPDHGLSAGSYFSIFGANLAPTRTPVTQLVNGRLPFVLEGTAVVINGNCAPLTFVSPEQINGQAPAGMAGTSAVIEVRSLATGNDCQTGSPGTSVGVPHSAVSPAFFVYSTNQIIALHEDGATLVSASAPTH